MRQAVPRRQRHQEAPRGLRVDGRQVGVQLPHLRNRVRDPAPPQRTLRAALQGRVEGKDWRCNSRLENHSNFVRLTDFIQAINVIVINQL